MVLRGSNIVPDKPFKAAEDDLSKAQDEIQEINNELKAAQSNVLQLLTSDVLNGMNREQLISIAEEYRSRIIFLENQKRNAESQFAKAMEELQKTIMQFGCGGLAGTIARTTVAPIDRIKIIMQTAAVKGLDHKYNSMLSTAQHIIKEEGFSRLWRGNFTNCVRVAPNTATQFLSYEKFKALLLGEDETMTVAKRLVAGALAGMTAATVTHPMDVVRIRLQTEPQLRGISDAVLHVYKEAGLISFFKGYTPTMLSLAPFIAINFATMDSLKHWYYADVKAGNEKKKQSPVVILTLGAISGIIAQTACYPLDTVRRRMQLAGKAYSSTADAFVTIVKTEGIRGFYKGIIPNALKIMPNNAIRFAAYETLKDLFVSPSNHG